MPRRNNRNTQYDGARGDDHRREDARSRATYSGGRSGRERRLSVRSVRRDQPDTRKIARAIIAMALAEAEAEAAAQAAETEIKKDSAGAITEADQ